MSRPYRRILISLLKMTSNVMESPSKRSKVVIAFNSSEKNRLLKQEILSRMAKEMKVVLLSLSKGEELCDAELSELIQSQTGNLPCKSAHP